MAAFRPYTVCASCTCMPCFASHASHTKTQKYVNDERQGALGTAGHRHAGPYPPIVFVYFVLSRFVTSLARIYFKPYRKYAYRQDKIDTKR